MGYGRANWLVWIRNGTKLVSLEHSHLVCNLLESEAQDVLVPLTDWGSSFDWGSCIFFILVEPRNVNTTERVVPSILSPIWTSAAHLPHRNPNTVPASAGNGNLKCYNPCFSLKDSLTDKRWIPSRYYARFWFASGCCAFFCYISPSMGA